jgi:hypothetical protein
LERQQSYLIKRKSSSSSEDLPAVQIPAIIETTQGEDAYEDSFETPAVAIIGEILHSEGDPELLIVDGGGLYPVASTQLASPELEQMLATLLRHISMNSISPALHLAPRFSVLMELLMKSRKKCYWD